MRRMGPPQRRSSRQHGMSLLVTLLAMLILSVSAVALIHSFDTSLLLAGNLAFKRDLVNEGERGMAAAIVLFDSGALADDSARTADLLTSNYSSRILEVNARGIPLVLINDTTFSGAHMSAADIADSTTGVKIRTVIDRQCADAGSFDATSCVYTPSTSDVGGTNWVKKAGSDYMPVYRISVRVSGPRNTQVFLQTTLSR
jgi:type IV pilus assembly protein PilX